MHQRRGHRTGTSATEQLAGSYRRIDYVTFNGKRISETEAIAIATDLAKRR
jgi:hypothetical protein